MIDEWAKQWCVDPRAVADLKRRMGVSASLCTPQTHELGIGDPPGSEGRQQSLVMLEAADKDVRLFRNNSGALPDKNGRLVRYGLGNVSKAVNDVFKSPDLVGWRKRVITPEMVGCVIAQAVLREMKHEGWIFNPNDLHEQAQLNFLNLGIADGADAGFATGPGTL